MPGLPDIVEQIDRLDPVEREELLARFRPPSERLAPDPSSPEVAFRPARFPGVVRTPGVCGGAARFIRTRVPVWAVVRLQQLGASDVDILRSYPSLRAVDLAEAWAFADDYRDEIAREVRENEEE